MRLRYIKNLCLSLTVLIALGGSLSAHAQYPGFDAPGTRVSGGGAVGLIPVEDNIDGGSVPIGATSQVVVLFRNEGAQPIQTGKINLYPSSNLAANVSLNQCGVEILPSGAECAVAISVKGLQAGSWRLEMLMLHSGRSRLVTATLSGNIESSGDSSDKLSSDIETIPSELNFGSLTSGQTMVEPVILRNITSNSIKISDVFINSSERSGYVVESNCEELQAGQACIATVTWSPKQKGPSTGVLVINHSGATALASVALSGNYAPSSVDGAEIFPEAVPGKGLLISSQVEVQFGAMVSSASTITVSLVNTGDSPLTLNDIKISGSDNGVSVSNSGCASGVVLQPVEACPLTLTWSPTRIGALLDDVQILHDGARGILVLPIRGNSIEVVSQDQKAIILSEATVTHVIGRDGVTADTEIVKTPQKIISQPKKSDTSNNNVNALSALDGLKITSFSSKHAIVNGPSGSRLISNKEQVMLGGVVWDVNIQRNGIEFANGANVVLLLFDRSLSSLNRISGKSSRKSSGSRNSPSAKNSSLTRGSNLQNNSYSPSNSKAVNQY